MPGRLALSSRSSATATHPGLGLGLTLTLCLLAVSGLGQAPAETARAVFESAVADFENGRLEQAVAGFDRAAELSPESAPHLWQRGIALYYVGRFSDCRAQFESHRLVNPNDVENAAWHFLCVAREASPQKAVEELLPVGLDPRLPMLEIYQMFRGALSPARVLEAAGEQTAAQFYAHLYIGLYYEALGNAKEARKHISEAAHKRYAAGGYMHTVARVHYERLGRGE